MNKIISALLVSSSLLLSGFAGTGLEKKETEEDDRPVQLQKLDEIDIPDYKEGEEPYVEINNNVPFFEKKEMKLSEFQYYDALDDLGRCSYAYIMVSPKSVALAVNRKSIADIEPTGWHSVKYEGVVDDGYLYNRCHLIGFALSGEDNNKLNLITGTRFLNTHGMLPYETEVSYYVKTTGNHVLYRVTPVFEGKNLVASGVLMEAYSVEDEGEGIEFCAYIYNVQPGVVIDYKTGDSHLKDGVKAAPSSSPSSSPAVKSSAASPAATAAAAKASSAKASSAQTYVLNTSTRKFHKPSCSSVSDMKAKNKKVVEDTRDAIIAMGYQPCKKCNP